MLSSVCAAAVVGVAGYRVDVEIDIAPGLPTLSTVGLPDAAVRESKDRVVAAVRNSGFDFPARRVTVNLAPADVKKEGAAFDLPIAIGILLAQGAVRTGGAEGYCLVGELALDGTVRPVKGVLPIAVGMQRLGVTRLLVPRQNAAEAAVAEGMTVLPVDSLRQVVDHLNGVALIGPVSVPRGGHPSGGDDAGLDWADVKGQQFAKRALEIAAAGGHNVIMVGPPGSGKTMLAKRLVTILPPLTFAESLETTTVFSVAGQLPCGMGLVMHRPFRAPHHTVSDVALVGGGAVPRPGEVSLAHNGVLFLDELTEFHRDVLEVLRQPLEDHAVMVSRARTSVTYPAAFTLVAAMNPCPCGNHGHPSKECRCTPFQVQKYRGRISGPLLDRIDLHLEVPALKLPELTEDLPPGESSAAVRERVVAARDRQKTRLTGTDAHCNARMNARQTRHYCVLSPESRALLRTAAERFGMSARAYDRVLRVSRTVADLAGAERIAPEHVAEAVQYRFQE